MRINAKGMALIKRFEGLSLEAYLCQGKRLTIGYGHTGNVKVGDRISAVEADMLLSLDLDHFEKGVLRLVQVPLNENQLSALVCLAFNVGLDEDTDTMAEGLGDSTLLKKLNASRYVGAANEFLKWNKAGGVVLPGLVKRRVAERDLFLEMP